MDAITLENVTKSYDSVTAVNGVNLRVRQGAILGLLGPNGAGKTTTIRMIMNILVPDEGSIKVLDQPVNDRTRDLIGYLPEERGLYPRMKVLDIIVFLAALHGLTEEEAARRAKEWLERLEAQAGALEESRGELPAVLAGLREAFGQHLVVENDVDAAALAEQAHGYGRDFASFAFVWIGTGIGMGLVLDGRLHRGADGAAGDIGHVRVTDGDDTVCTCGNTGCLEAVASGAAVARRLALDGLDARTATIKAMDEITGPILAITLVLCAVFVPCAFIPGITGRFFQQFAVTISASMIISAPCPSYAMICLPESGVLSITARFRSPPGN